MYRIHTVCLYVSTSVFYSFFFLVVLFTCHCYCTPFHEYSQHIFYTRKKKKTRQKLNEQRKKEEKKIVYNWHGQTPFIHLYRTVLYFTWNQLSVIEYKLNGATYFICYFAVWFLFANGKFHILFETDHRRFSGVEKQYTHLYKRNKSGDFIKKKRNRIFFLNFTFFWLSYKHIRLYYDTCFISTFNTSYYLGWVFCALRGLANGPAKSCWIDFNSI